MDNNTLQLIADKLNSISSTLLVMHFFIGTYVSYKIITDIINAARGKR